MRACSGDICSFIMLPNWNVMPQPQVMTPQSATIQGHRSDLSLCFYCLCSAKPSRPTTIIFTNSVYLGLIHRNHNLTFNTGIERSIKMLSLCHAERSPVETTSYPESLKRVMWHVVLYKVRSTMAASRYMTEKQIKIMPYPNL